MKVKDLVREIGSKFDPHQTSYDINCVSEYLKLQQIARERQMTLETPAFTWSTNFPAATLGNVDTFCKELRKKYDQYCNPQEAKRAAYHMTSAFSDNPRDFLSRL